MENEKINEENVKVNQDTQEILNKSIVAILTNMPKSYKGFLEQEDKEKGYYYELEKIEDYHVIFMLYRLILGPAFQMKKKVENSEHNNDDAVIAVYGATIDPIRKRVMSLNPLSESISLDNGVILSGGRSWTSIVPKAINDYIEKNYKKDAKFKIEVDESVLRRMVRDNPIIKERIEQIVKDKKTYGVDTQNIMQILYRSNPNDLFENILKDLMTAEEFEEIRQKAFDEEMRFRRKQEINKRINSGEKVKVLSRERAENIMHRIKDMKKYLHDRDEEIWNEILAQEKKKYMDDGKDIPEELLRFNNYDEMYNQWIVDNIEKISDSKDSLKEYYLKYRKENSSEEEKASKNQDEISKRYEQDFEKWYEEYEQDKDSGMPFFDWLYGHLDTEHRISEIIHGVTEVELMQLVMKQGNISEKTKKVIEDRQATNTAENAENTIKEFLKLREENPNLKRLIVISDWNYLLRQVLTTKKAAEDAGLEDVEIIGYPADCLERQDDGKIIIADYKDVESCKKILLGELKKIAMYDDVSDMEIPNMDELDIGDFTEEGLVIRIDKQSAYDYLIDKTNTRTKDLVE